eukprot:10071395-Prorocentrum_lima.AAC.1
MGYISTPARALFAKLVATLPRAVHADTSALLMHQLHYLVEVGTASVLADAAGASPRGTTPARSRPVSYTHLRAHETRRHL